MEYNKINFAIIQECLLQAETKEQVQAIFNASALNILDNEISVVKADSLPAVLRGVPAAF